MILADNIYYNKLGVCPKPFLEVRKKCIVSVLNLRVWLSSTDLTIYQLPALKNVWRKHMTIKNDELSLINKKT